MVETVGVSLIIVGLILLGLLIFGGWLVVAFLRLVGRALFGGGPPRQAPPRLRRLVPCPNRGCGAENLLEARFCRHCGRRMTAVPERQPVARRVAV